MLWDHDMFLGLCLCKFHFWFACWEGEGLIYPVLITHSFIHSLFQGTDKAYRQHLKKLEVKQKQQDKKSVSEKNGANMDDVVKEDKKKMHKIKSQ